MYNPITKTDFASGGLRIDSVARVSQLFTLDEKMIEYQAGKLQEDKLKEVVNKILAMFAEE